MKIKKIFVTISVISVIIISGIFVFKGNVMAGSKKNIFTPGYVNISNSRFKKINFSPWLKRYLDKENIEIPYTLLSEDIKFTSYTLFPDEIKRFKPANTAVDKKSNTTIQTFKLSKLTTGKANTSLKVKFKK